MKEPITTIQYPIFLKTCQYVQDPFWTYIFEDLAYGRCPYGIIIQQECIYSILKNKEFTYPFKNKAPEQITEDLTKLFGTKLNMFSQQDHLRFRHKYQLSLKNYLDTLTSWNDIKKKNLRFLLLELFAIEQKTQFSYSISFTRQLYSLIFIGIQFKTIVAKHIHYQNRRIQSIDGIFCYPTCFRCAFNIFLSSKKSLPSHTIPTIKSSSSRKVSQGWKRYLASL